MKIIVSFLAGGAVGMWLVIFYMDGPRVGKLLSQKLQLGNRIVSSEKIVSTQLPSLEIAELTSTPTLTPTLEPTQTPTPKPTEKPTQTPTPKPVQPKFSSSEINGFIDRFAPQYGVDPNVLRAIAMCESGFDAARVSRNGLYLGLFQFSTNAWKTNRKTMGEDPNPDLRLNAEEAVQTAAYAVSVGKGGLWPNCMP